jgi:hypothetical protein
MYTPFYVRRSKEELFRGDTELGLLLYQPSARARLAPISAINKS